MEVRSLRQRWGDGATTLGAWISLRDPLLAEVAGMAGFDYVVVDMQHGLNDYSDVVAMLQAVSGSATVPLVRVPWNEQGIIGRVLDAGALGVIIPMVNTADEARRAVTACRYPPDGTRSIGPFVARIRYGLDYPSIANERRGVHPDDRDSSSGRRHRRDPRRARDRRRVRRTGRPVDVLRPRATGRPARRALRQRHRRGGRRLPTSSGDARDPRQHLTRREAPRRRASA